jgi:hypothetical protein
VIFATIQTYSNVNLDFNLCQEIAIKDRLIAGDLFPNIEIKQPLFESQHFDTWSELENACGGEEQRIAPLKKCIGIQLHFPSKKFCN